MSTTLADLRLMTRELADIVSSSFVTTAELDRYINQVGSELHEKLVVRYEDYFTSPTPTTFSLSGSTNTYALPSDFFKLRGVDYSDGGTWVSVHRYQHEERDRFVRPTYYTYGGEERRFTVMGNSIVVAPESNAAGDYRFWYVPKWTNLSASSEPLPTAMEQWAEYIQVGAAIKCMLKEESDASALIMRKRELDARIDANAQNRDAHDQEMILSTGWSWW